MAAAAIVGLRPRPAASLSPSRPLAAQRFLQRPDRQQANPLFSRYLSMAESFGQTQDDLGPENIPLAAGLGRHDALEFALLFRGNLNQNGGWHIPDNATARALRNRIYGTLH